MGNEGIAAPAAEVPAVSAPAVPSAPVTPEPKTLANVGDSAFAKLNGPAVPAIPDEGAKPPLNPDDVPGNDKTEGEVELSPETKKLLDDAVAKGKYIPKQRMDEVLKEIKAFKDFGTLEDLKQMRQTLYDLMARAGGPEKPPVTGPEKDPELTPEEKEEVGKAREFFLKAFPEFKDLMALKDEFPKLKEDYEKRINSSVETQRAERTNLVKTGSDNIKTWAEKAGLDVSDGPSYGAVLDGVSAFLEADEALAKGFYQDRNMDSLKAAFDKYYDRFYSKFQRSAKAEILDGKIKKGGLPKAPVSGAPPAPIAEPKIKNLKEAGDRGWARLSGTS